MTWVKIENNRINSKYLNKKQALHITIHAIVSLLKFDGFDVCLKWGLKYVSDENIYKKILAEFSCEWSPRCGVGKA